MTRRVLFVAGAHTDIGKTHVACALIRAARAEGWTVDALKPVVSGFDERAWAASDPGRLLAALGRAGDADRVDLISPWRFGAPLAPPMAARGEGRALPLAAVVDYCRRRIWDTPADLMVVEGVGGLMSPIADGGTSLDLIDALAGWSLLVGGAYLGAVSHTLTALEVMRARALPPAAVLVSEDGSGDAPDFPATVELVREHAGATPVIAVPRTGAAAAWARLALELVFG